MTLRSASCSYGQLRLTASEEPIRVSICHCVACQRRAGSVFGAQARFSRHAVQVSGESSAYVRIGDEGGRTTFHFCPKCGATVHCPSEGDEEHIAVPVGAFVEPGFPAPSLSVYEERMHSWVGLLSPMEHTA